MKTIPRSWKRLLAHVIDQVVGLILVSPVLFFAFSAYWNNEEIVLHWSLVLFYVLVPIVYETMSYFLFQSTIGKWVFNLKLVFRGSDKALDLGTCLLRVITSRLSWFLSLAPFALIFLRYDRTHIADWIAGTRVIDLAAPYRRTKRYVFMALVLFGLYSWQGLKNAQIFLREMKFENSFFYIPNSQGGFEVSLAVEDE